MTRVKICGLRSGEDIAAANVLKPDYVGFVFLKGRARYVPPEYAAQLRELLDEAIPAVGVFVDEPVENVVRLLQSGVIQLAQLHGNEDETYIQRLRDACPQPVIKAFLVRTKEDAARAMRSSADYLLLDGGLGQGKTFDWSLIGAAGRAFFLAGGLNPGNVRTAIQNLRPFAVDVSSGVETEGKKDFEKMRAFVEAVRRG